MKTRQILLAATMATLLAGAAGADGADRREGYERFRDQHFSDRYDDRRYPNRRYDRHWRHVPPAYYRGNQGYRAGYQAGWRDAAYSCHFGYRPGRWQRDPYGDWFFGLRFDN